MKPKVNSGMTLISFYYLFLLHQQHAVGGWRWFSASISGESTLDITGALGKKTLWKECRYHWAKLLWIFNSGTLRSTLFLTPKFLNEIFRWKKSGWLHWSWWHTINKLGCITLWHSTYNNNALIFFNFWSRSMAVVISAMTSISTYVVIWFPPLFV